MCVATVCPLVRCLALIRKTEMQTSPSSVVSLQGPVSFTISGTLHFSLDFVWFYLAACSSYDTLPQ